MSTILVVEDNASNRQPMARLLRAEGYDTLCVDNGQEALEALRFMTPDLVLLDMLMPVMDGLEFLEVLRQNTQWAALPVILWTAHPASDPRVQEARRLGIKDFFRKMDFTLDQLFSSIHQNLATF
jgi:CheY-like chemotaxis protein